MIIIIIFKFEEVVTHSINNTVWKKHSPKEMSIFVPEEVFMCFWTPSSFAIL